MQIRAQVFNLVQNFAELFDMQKIEEQNFSDRRRLDTHSYTHSDDNVCRLGLKQCQALEAHQEDNQTQSNKEINKATETRAHCQIHFEGSELQKH